MHALKEMQKVILRSHIKNTLTNGGSITIINNIVNRKERINKVKAIIFYAIKKTLYLCSLPSLVNKKK